MRFIGKLHTWNEDRGFGFIRPDGGGQDIFVHASALPSPRPQPLEALTFEIALNGQGKKKAVQVRRQAVEAAGLAADQAGIAQRQPRTDRSEWRPTRRASPVATFVIGGLLVAWLGSYAWQRFQPQQTLHVPEPLAQAPAAAASRTPLFRCDTRQHCSQMTSCEEATLFLKNCPTVKMDGDGDGIPCEQQWCKF